MKFTLNAVDSNVISITIFIILLVFALIAQNCVQIVTVILFYHLNVVILKDWLLKENFLFLVRVSSLLWALGQCFEHLEYWNPGLSSGLQHRAAGCCRPKAAREEQIQTAGPTKGSAAACNYTTTIWIYPQIIYRSQQGLEFVFNVHM